jgi:uncharacterized protein YbbK (DUF523 family)
MFMENPSPKLPKILVSACLLGQKVRYNAEILPHPGSILDKLEAQGRLIPFCPEVAGGLPVPRPPAEIQGGEGGCVLEGRCRVISAAGEDCTQAFVDGARQTLALAQSEQVTMAILKENSPSCGSAFVYDGSFSRKRLPGEGVTTALLRRHAIQVYSEHDLPSLEATL